MKRQNIGALQDLKQLHRSSWAAGNTGKSQYEKREWFSLQFAVLQVKQHASSQQYIIKHILMQTMVPFKCTTV